ncbi:hypothetical protein OROMI_007005 [Orobanche minor]
MEFSVALVEQLFGKDKAENVKGVLVPIANGSEEMEIISIVDVLHREKVEVIVASMEDTKETVGWASCAQKYASSEALVEMLKNQKSLKKPYEVICGSPALVLEPHVLLERTKAIFRGHCPVLITDLSSGVFFEAYNLS